MVQFAVYHALLAGYVSLMHVFPLSLLHTVHSAIHSLPFPACRVCIPDAVYYSLLAGYVSLMHVFPLSLPHSAIRSVPCPACRVCIPDARFLPEFTAYCT